MKANIRVGMVTGDNLMTACAVADEVGISRVRQNQVFETLEPKSRKLPKFIRIYTL